MFLEGEIRSCLGRRYYGRKVCECCFFHSKCAAEHKLSNAQTTEAGQLKRRNTTDSHAALFELSIASVAVGVDVHTWSIRGIRRDPI